MRLRLVSQAPGISASWPTKGAAGDTPAAQPCYHSGTTDWAMLWSSISKALRPITS